MASRGTIKLWLRNLLGAKTDDTWVDDVVLDPIIQQAADALLALIHEANPAYLSKSQALAADSGTSRNYTFATQAPAITDFSRWLEVRFTDQDGAKLSHARLEELPFAGGSYFDITGTDDTPVLVTSPATTAGVALWLRYAFWPVAMTDDNASPGGIPSRFHDVVALEALYAFGIGGEERRPPELEVQWQNRKGQLVAHVARRGVAPTLTRLTGNRGREA